jgi:L,D-transpeptidase ErfK/SrfK
MGFSMNVFPMKATSPQKAFSRYSLRIDVKTAKMWLYDGDRLERTYSVATGKPGVPSPSGEGKVLMVIYNPSWHPMPKTRKFYKEVKKIDLPANVAFGDPNNMLGAFKMVLSHRSKAYDIAGVYAIHGTPDDKSIGKRVTGGCIRMHKDEGLELAKRVEAEMKAGRVVRVIIEAK